VEDKIGAACRGRRWPLKNLQKQTTANKTATPRALRNKARFTAAPAVRKAAVGTRELVAA